MRRSGARTIFGSQAPPDVLSDRVPHRVHHAALSRPKSGGFPTLAGRREGWHPGLWEYPAYLEAYELPEGAQTCSQKEMRSYIAFVDDLVDPIVDALDLDTDDSGFSWYEDTSKLSHELMNLRHIQGHVGQLSELLMSRVIDIDWVSHGSVP